jgi:transposase-like protein
VPPVVAVADGALGFWAAVRDVWPKTREQRDWVPRRLSLRNKRREKGNHVVDLILAQGERLDVLLLRENPF